MLAFLLLALSMCSSHRAAYMAVDSFCFSAGLFLALSKLKDRFHKTKYIFHTSVMDSICTAETAGRFTKTHKPSRKL